MRSFKELAADNKTPKYLQKTYAILNNKDYTADSSRPGSHSIDDIDSIQQIAFEEVKANLVKDGLSFQSLEECKQLIAKDGFYNPMSNINTPQDAGYYNQAFVPIAMGPMDATASYSSGGLPQLIIDKKAKSVLLNGYQFESKHSFWTHDKLSRLKEYADSIGFQAKLVDALRDGFIYGGSVLYPSFKKDDVNTFRLGVKQLLKQGILSKDCISHWVHADRWNTVVIPDYNITAQDYLFAKQYYIPLAGLSVATERSAVIRPKELPYWGAIRQLGWGSSDYEGYIKSILGYEVLIASIPIMAQQMSLLIHEIPLDGIIAQNGLESARDFMKENDDQLRRWSMNNPKTVNAFGKISTVNRSYTGYDDLGMMLRQDIAAQSGIPEAVLFHTQPKGFSNNTEESLLKQSETVRMTQNAILPILRPLVEIMVVSCFGPEEEFIKALPYLQINFESPVVATETERSESSARYAASLSSLVTAGVPIKEAVELMQQFFREIEISGDFLLAVEQREKEKIAKEEEKVKADHEAAKAKAEAEASTEGPPAKKKTDEAKNLNNNIKEGAKSVE